LREDIPAGSCILTETAIGFDGLLHFYEGYDWILDTALSDTLVEYLEWPDTLSYPYAVNANRDLVQIFSQENFKKGITISAPGFYAPQEENSGWKLLTTKSILNYLSSPSGAGQSVIMRWRVRQFMDYQPSLATKH